MNKYSRYGAVIKTEESGDYWAKEFEKNLEKAAVQPRSEIFHEINSIMNGNARFSSVQSKVDDMMERSGLISYLKEAENNEVDNKKIASKQLDHLITQAKQAAINNDWDKLGELIGKIDIEEKYPRTNAAEAIRTIKYFKDKDLANVKIPNHKWIDFTRGYDAAWKLSKEECDKDMKFTLDILDRLSNARQDKIEQYNPKKASNNQEKNKYPKVIQERPQILNTLQNILQDTKGHFSINQIINKLQSLHKGEISNDGDWNDADLIRFISKLNLAAKMNNPSMQADNGNLGRLDFGNDNIPVGNSDFFAGLLPTKI